MTTSIKNNKKVSIIRSAAMMLTVALAIGFSAFTTVSKRIAGDVYGNKLNNGTYSILANPYDNSFCSSGSSACWVYR